MLRGPGLLDLLDSVDIAAQSEGRIPLIFEQVCSVIEASRASTQMQLHGLTSPDAAGPFTALGRCTDWQQIALAELRGQRQEALLQKKEEKLRILIHRWQLRWVSSYWREWKECGRIRGVRTRIFRRFVMAHVHAAFNQWAAWTSDMLRIKELLGNVSKVWGATPMARAFRTWDWWVLQILRARENAKEERQRQWLLRQLFKGCPDE